MKNLPASLTTLLLLLPFSLPAEEEGKEPSPRVYELRTYYAHEGKLDALHARFRDHTCKLFEKHGMRNLGYWVPVQNKDNRLVYIISHASRQAARNSWGAFLGDPDWVAAYKASIKGGKLVRKIESTFLTATDYSPVLKIEAADPDRLFELRTYVTNEGKRPDINSRFRDHTCALFTRHGMTNILYCDLMEDQDGADITLTYLISHRDAKTRAASWEGFRKDPDWQAARTASEKKGPILRKPGGVQSTLLVATDYSPMK